MHLFSWCVGVCSFVLEGKDGEQSRLECRGGEPRTLFSGRSPRTEMGPSGAGKAGRRGGRSTLP